MSCNYLVRTTLRLDPADLEDLPPEATNRLIER